MFKGFFSAQAFEERARERERRKLVRELDDLIAFEQYALIRRDQISQRLTALAGKDFDEWITELRATSHSKYTATVMASKATYDALRIGEPLWPRSRGES